MSLNIDGALFFVGIDWASEIHAVCVQDAGGSDLVHIAKVTASTYSAGPPKVVNLTIDRPIPNGVTFNVGGKVSAVNRINVGSTTAQPNFAAKVVGILSEADPRVNMRSGLGDWAVVVLVGGGMLCPEQEAGGIVAMLRRLPDGLDVAVEQP